MSSVTALGHRPRHIRMAAAQAAPVEHEGGHLAPSAGSPPVDHARLRLTRRGRVVVLMLALSLALVVGVFLGAGSVASQERGVPSPTRVVVVGDGQTLWGIASDIAATEPHADVREVIAEIERLNALDSAMLYAGQRIRVPAP